MYKVFETERLILKPTCEEDALFFLELFNSPTWIRYIGDRNVITIESAREYIIDNIIPQMKRLGYSNYTVIKKIDNTKIGSCGLYDREGIDGIDIGFAFLPKHEKMGYAFEAASKIKKIASDVYGIHELKAITTVDNIQSKKLLDKIGLKFSERITLPNDNEELLLYKN